jgi:hypothetical protein
MHTLMKVTMDDMAAANQAITSGRLPRIFQNTTQLIKPETSFFTAENGYRTAIFIFDMKDASKIPMICEPFFTELNARVEFFPGMDVSEMEKGLGEWNKQESNQQSLS